MRAASSSPTKPTDKQILNLGKIIRIVNDLEWIRRLCDHHKSTGLITDVQLRINGETDPAAISALVRSSQTLCANAGVQLWINDHWRDSLDSGCFRVHLGQEDLRRCADSGGLDWLRTSRTALGISTHSYAELAVSCGVEPSYVSLGPVFGTKSKVVEFRPQGLETVGDWRMLVVPGVPLVPLVVIGEIEYDRVARSVRDAGVDFVAVTGAVTRVEDFGVTIRCLVDAMEL